MNLLIRIWKFQYIRNFKWMEQGQILFLCLLAPVVVLPTVYYEFYDKIQAFLANADFSLIVVIGALVFQISDFLYKLTLVQGCSDISDYLKTRPVSIVTWCRFIMFDNIFTGTNWVFIPAIATCLFLLLDFPTALLSSLLFIVISITNGLALQTLFYSHSYESKIITFSAGFLFFPITAILMWKTFSVNRWLHIVVYIALCIMMQYFLYRCLRILRNYPDYSRTTSKSHSFFVKESTLPVWGALKSNILRYCLVMSQIMTLMFFIMSLTDMAHPLEAPNIITPFMLSSLVGVVIFGTEANYMDGLWSRPVSIKKLLRHNYLFYTSICTIDAVLLCLAVCHNGISQVILVLSAALYTIGIYNNIYLTGIFGSSRLELFQRSLMKRNGRQTNFTVIMTFFPTALFELLLATFAPMEIFCWVAGGLGIVGILLNPYITDKVAKKYVANRYRHFERYRN